MKTLGIAASALFLVQAAFCARAEEIGSFNASAPAAVAADCRDGKLLQRNPACAFGKDSYLVAWTDGSRQPLKAAADIYCARLDKSGKPLDPKGIAVCRADWIQDYPAVAFDGTNFLVVWEDYRNGRDADIYAARVTPEGKVLDPDGFPVAALKDSNQARPAVAFAKGNYVVAWMDSRAYPVYGLYFARVSPEGKVLDPEGKVLDAESPEKLKNAPKPGERWPAKNNYWWGGLDSRISPRAASNGTTVLIAYIRETNYDGGSTPKASGALIDPATGDLVAKPIQFAGKGHGAATAPHDRVWPCATDKGWAVAFDNWVGGWTPHPELVVMRLDSALDTPDRCQTSQENAAGVPRAQVDKEFGGGYNYGKGMDAFWQASSAWNGRHVVAVMAYAVRDGKAPAGKSLKFMIIANRAESAGNPKFLDDKCVVLASADGGMSVNHPALAAGVNGVVLLVYVRDEGIDKLCLMFRLVNEK